MKRTPEDIGAAKSMRRICEAIYVIWRFTHDDTLRADAARTLLSNWGAVHGGVAVSELAESAGYRRKDLNRMVTAEEQRTRL